MKFQYPRIKSINDAQMYLCKLVDTLNATITSNRTESYYGKDFNLLISENKTYSCDTAPLSAEVKNAPVNKAGLLTVNSFIEQYAYQTYLTNDLELYARTYSTQKGWSKWEKI